MDSDCYDFMEEHGHECMSAATLQTVELSHV